MGHRRQLFFFARDRSLQLELGDICKLFDVCPLQRRGRGEVSLDKRQLWATHPHLLAGLVRLVGSGAAVLHTRYCDAPPPKRWPEKHACSSVRHAFAPASERLMCARVSDVRWGAAASGHRAHSHACCYMPAAYLFVQRMLRRVGFGCTACIMQAHVPGGGLVGRRLNCLDVDTILCPGCPNCCCCCCAASSYADSPAQRQGAYLGAGGSA